MTDAEKIVSKLKDVKSELGITLNSPASLTEIERLESILERKLPKDLREFYLLANGFETDDYLFRVIPVEEIIMNKNEVEQNRLYFAEYMIYIDSWDIILNSEDVEQYWVVNTDHGSDETVTLTNSIFEFIQRYLQGDGVFGGNGLYQWYNENKK